MDIKKMQVKLQEIAAERDWETFHTPKNLVMGLSGEVGELTELFQWLTPAEAEVIMNDDSKAIAVQDELADILTYLLRLSDKLNVDLEKAFWRKIALTEAKYPIDKARGNAKKYTEF